MSDREFWDCSFPQFVRLQGRWIEEQQRQDWRAWIAGVASVMEKPPKPSEAFSSLAALTGGGLRRDEIPKGWKVYTGADAAVVQQVNALAIEARLGRAVTVN